MVWKGELQDEATMYARRRITPRRCDFYAVLREEQEDLTLDDPELGYKVTSSPLDRHWPVPVPT